MFLSNKAYYIIINKFFSLKHNERKRNKLILNLHKLNEKRKIFLLFIHRII